MAVREMRKTLGDTVAFEGVGVHGGEPARMRIEPAPAGSGIRFVRTDVPSGRGEVAASYDRVVDAMLCTRIGNGYGTTVATVEHVLAALAGCGVTDARILLDGPEVPIMDGSAAPFVAKILAAGIVDTGVPCRAIRMLRTVAVERDGKSAALAPAGRFEMAYRIAFGDPAIGEQTRELALVGDAFLTELSDCRTFSLLRDVERLRRLGLGRGGSLQNAIVVDNGRVLNAGGLRRRDEFVRHKMLDAVGDLALAGAPVIGRFTADKAGHALTNQLLRALFARRDAWRWEDLGPGQWFGGDIRAPVATATREGAVAV